ncbi:MAG: hypothetical protein ACTSQY_11470 [Candidatus Odinarchaeia archaeon]
MPEGKKKVYIFSCPDCDEEFRVPENSKLLDPKRAKFCLYCGSYLEKGESRKKRS